MNKPAPALPALNDRHRDPRLDDLAAAACLSPYHFHRIYHDDPGRVPAQDLRVLDLAGGRHAVLRFQGPYAELETPYNWLFGGMADGNLSAARDPLDG